MTKDAFLACHHAVAPRQSEISANISLAELSCQPIHCFEMLWLWLDDVVPCCTLLKVCVSTPSAIPLNTFIFDSMHARKLKHLNSTIPSLLPLQRLGSRFTKDHTVHSKLTWQCPATIDAGHPQATSTQLGVWSTCCSIRFVQQCYPHHGVHFTSTVPP